MEVSAEKTVAQLFTMSTKKHVVNLVYKNRPLKKVFLSKYLRINLDTKPSWGAHVTETAEKSQKRNNLLKRLTSTKWGATQDVLATAYKAYVHPVMEYGGEVTSLASKTNLAKYDVVQNNALRVITGGAKSTPIPAMLLQTGVEPLDTRREKSTLKFWERVKRVDRNYWVGYKNASQRLKTQASPLTYAESLMTKYNLSLDNPAPLRQYTSVVTALPTKRLDLMGLTSYKTDTNPSELKACPLETINSRYPPKEWVHIYTDGSYIPETKGAGAGWFCSLFEDSMPVGKNASNYDGEVCAVLQASNQLNTMKINPTQVVFFIDSQAAILALSNNVPTDCLRTMHCRENLAQLIKNGWTVALQWVPSHVGIAGNEKADIMAKRGAETNQPEVPLTLHRARNVITNTVNKATMDSLKDLCKGKKWESLSEKVIPTHLPRAEAVARFRLTTGHDYLQEHLHRIGLAADDTCPLCGHGRMNGDHLKACQALTNPNDDIPTRYWEARRLMMEASKTGVG